MNRNIDKLKIADSFLKSIATYEQNSQAQEIAAETLLTLCTPLLPEKLKNVLEVGCGTGLLTRKFVKEFEIENLVLSDLSAGICNYCKEQVSDSVKNIEYLVGDIEKVTFPKNCDMIISSSSLQWLEDIDTFFEQCAHCLRSNSYLVLSMFGSGTMQEITELTGKGLRYSSKAQVIENVEKYFKIERAEEVNNKLFFNSVKEIVKHIRQTGVAGVKQSPLTVAQYKKFEKDYERFFSTEAGLPVSYNSIFVIARKK